MLWADVRTAPKRHMEIAFQQRRQQIVGDCRRGILKKCVNGQAVYPLSEQDGLKAQERRYTAYGKEKH